MAEEVKPEATKPEPGQDVDDIIYVPPVTPPTVVVNDSDSDSNNSWKSNQTEDTRACNNEIRQINGFYDKAKSVAFPPAATSVNSEVETITNQMKIEIEDEKISNNSGAFESIPNRKDNFNDNESSNESDKTSPFKMNPMAIHIPSDDDDDDDETNNRNNDNIQHLQRRYMIRSLSPSRFFINSAAGADSALSSAMLDRIFNRTADMAYNGRDIDEIPNSSHGSISENERDTRDIETIPHNPDGETINKYSRKVVPKKLTCLNCGAQGHKTCDCTVPFKIACDQCGSFDNFVRCTRCGAQCENKCTCFMEKTIAFCSKCKLELHDIAAAGNNRTVTNSTDDVGTFKTIPPFEHISNNNNDNNIPNINDNNNVFNKNIVNDSIGLKKKEFEKTMDDAQDAHFMRPKPNWFSRNNDGYRLARKSKSFPKNYHKRSHDKSISQTKINSLQTSNGISENTTLNDNEEDEEEQDSQNSEAKARGYFNRRSSLSISSASDDLEIVEVANRNASQGPTNTTNPEEGPKKEITYVLSSGPEDEAAPDNPSQSPKENTESQAGLIVIDSGSDISVGASCSQSNEKPANGLLKYIRVLPIRPRYSSTSSDSDNADGESPTQKRRRKRANPLAIVIDDSDYDGDDDTPPSKSPTHKPSLPLKKRKTNFQRRLSVNREDGIEMGIDVDNTLSGQYPTFVPHIKRGPAIEKFNSY